MQQQYPASACTPRAISANLLSLRRAIDAIVRYQNTPKYVPKKMMQTHGSVREFSMYDFRHLNYEEELHRSK